MSLSPLCWVAVEAVCIILSGNKLIDFINFLSTESQYIMGFMREII